MLQLIAGENGTLAQIFLAGCELCGKHHAPATVAHEWSVLPFHTLQMPLEEKVQGI
jgi:hypothetical protein